MADKKALLESINEKIDKISLDMEKFKFVDYVNYLEHPRKLLWSNFLGGLSRGVGIAIGFTILGAVVIYLLEKIVKLNLPLIGEIISEIVKIVQDNMQRTGGRIDG